MWGVLQLAARMREEGRSGSIVTLLCDSGERYLESYYNSAWVNDHIGDLSPFKAEIARLISIRFFYTRLYTSYFKPQVR